MKRLLSIAAALLFSLSVAAQTVTLTQVTSASQTDYRSYTSPSSKLVYKTVLTDLDGDGKYDLRAYSFNQWQKFTAMRASSIYQTAHAQHSFSVMDQKEFLFVGYASGWTYASSWLVQDSYFKKGVWNGWPQTAGTYYFLSKKTGVLYKVDWQIEDPSQPYSEMLFEVTSL